MSEPQQIPPGDVFLRPGEVARRLGYSAQGGRPPRRHRRHLPPLATDRGHRLEGDLAERIGRLAALLAGGAGERDDQEGAATQHAASRRPPRAEGSVPEHEGEACAARPTCSRSVRRGVPPSRRAGARSDTAATRGAAVGAASRRRGRGAPRRRLVSPIDASADTVIASRGAAGERRRARRVGAAELGGSPAGSVTQHALPIPRERQSVGESTGFPRGGSPPSAAAAASAASARIVSP